MKIRFLLALSCCVDVVAVCRPAEAQPAIEMLDVQPKPTVFGEARRPPQQPLAIRSAEKAAKHFDDQGVEALNKAVDWEKQFVLVFAWRGSGQDKLSFVVAESFPEQITFHYKPGRTRDLRPHVYVYALRSNVKWQPPNR